MILEDLQLTPSEFADRIGVQRSSISHVLSGRNKPGLDFLEKILNTFPEIDAAWLITGKKGQNLYNKEAETGDLKKNNEPKNSPQLNLEYKKPPLPADEEAVDHIILVYKNNTYRILRPSEK
jgi:transcriptional regulator with XRE-family HTH domain